MSAEEAKTSKYSKSGKAYYEAHKDEILASEKDKKRWLSYYERNRETVKERNRQQYYLRQGRPVPPLRPKPATSPVTPPEPIELKRLEELVAELRTLLPEVVKKKARPRKTPGLLGGEEATPAAPAPVSEPPADLPALEK